MSVDYVKVRPILYTGEMVRQIYAGRKSQTRRVAKGFQGCDGTHTDGPTTCRPMLLESGEWGWGIETGGDVHGPLKRCPYGKPGDLLWVRETWAAHWMYDEVSPSKIARKAHNGLWFRAEGDQQGLVDRGRWRPSIHMPRWASRLTLRVTDVRVERVQYVSEEDARAEGVTGHDPEPVDEGGTIYAWPGRSSAPCPRAHFAHLWDSINGKRPGCSWADNPWTWAVSFERVAP